MSSGTSWLSDAVSVFGAACKNKLSGPGDKEAAIRSPLEALLNAAGSNLYVPAVFHDEVRDAERQVRPDYAVKIKGAITGYVEVKAPGKSVDPTTFRGHDLRQWERQRDLPNLLYTNGTEWRLYQHGEAWGDVVWFRGGPLDRAGSELEAPAAFESMLSAFLRWEPTPIRSVGALVAAVAPLTRLLRGEVMDQLVRERRVVKAGADKEDQPFLGLASDWRNLLFPHAKDETFADGYAQTVTFALLLARTDGVDLAGRSLHSVGSELGADYSLMGRALQLLTDDIAREFVVTLDLLVRVVGAVDWPHIRQGKRDAYLHLYEHFLEEYDNSLRKQSGSYYTPREVVEEMIRLTEEALTTRLGKKAGFADPGVFTIDPAMGTGTYLHTILEHAAQKTAAEDGPGAVAGVLAQIAQNLVGFELQMGPYTVAELRAADLLHKYGASHAARPQLYVTDTLDDPYAAQAQLGHGLRMIALSRRKANEVKAESNVTVVIGNPPYRERAEGLGGWVEKGSREDGGKSKILDDFREPGNGRFEYTLKNLYIYFWRWATWKVWESTLTRQPDSDPGVICFITTSGYLRGPGFRGMRRYMREWASEGWIIDVSPEGMRPDVPTRVFPGVQQPLAIGLFVRASGTKNDVPARIRTRAVHGRRAAKFKALATVTLDDAEWQDTRTAWTAALTPAAAGSWDDHPAMDDLLCWSSAGAKMNRTWVYSPSQDVLVDRWRQMMSEPDASERARLFKETDTSTLDRPKDPLPGTAEDTSVPLRGALITDPPIAKVGFRSFDRQHVISDARVLDRPRPDLWEALRPGQIYTVEQHAEPIESGPGLVFSALVPDMHHFNNRGGRTLPLLHPDGTSNVANGLAHALTAEIGRTVTDSDVVAYAAGVAAHAGYTATFSEELATPGVRVPITTDSNLFAEAIELGKQVVWLHTYGQAFSGMARPAGQVRYPADNNRRALASKPVSRMPETLTYDGATQTIHVGEGEFGPVRPEVWNYEVGGKNVLKSWFNYRKATPGGKKTSPLDSVHLDHWPSAWTTEFLELLDVLAQLAELEPAQADLLTRILAAPTLSKAALSKAGTQWPEAKADRQVHHRADTPHPDALDFTLLG